MRAVYALRYQSERRKLSRATRTALDFVEDQIMKLGPRRAEAGVALRSASEILRPWATVSGPTIAVETVERWFARLAVAAQGQASALDGLPAGREAAAALLVLREFMHHRGYPSIAVVDRRQQIGDAGG